MIEKLKETSLAIGVLVAVVGITFLFDASPFDITLFSNFLFCSVLVIFGQLIFLLGVDNSLLKVGKHSGSALMKIGKVWLILLFGFILGFITTIAEPDVQVLSSLISPNNNSYFKLIFTIVLGLGVALLSVVAFVRILKNIPIKYVFTGIYLLIFILALFSPEEFLMLSFDSSGTTTGAITIPFLLSLTVGICHIRANNKKEDNFGVIGIATTGTIITVLIMSYFVPSNTINLTVTGENFITTLLGTSLEVLIALLPLFAIFIIMQIFYFKFPIKYVSKILAGYFLTALGLVVFLTGVIYGFAPLGEYLGRTIQSTIIIYLLSAVLGVILVFTEPSIKVLMIQIEEVSDGLIKKKFVYLALCISVAFALLMATARVYYDFSFWWYIAPLLFITVSLMYFTPKIYYSLAFDSGGIVAGTILASFVFPFYIGLSINVHQTGINALGVIALVTLTPIIALEILGIINKIITTKKQRELEEKVNKEEKQWEHAF